MSEHDELLYIEAELRTRLRLVDPTSDAGNGTLLADAAATIIAADAVQAEKGRKAVAGMTDAELAAAMKLVGDLLGGATILDVPLPFGTNAREIDPGLVMVGDQHYVLADTLSGMIPRHAAPAFQAGPNFELFLEELRNATADRPSSGLGLPSGITEGGCVDQHLLHFAPCASAGGVSLDVPIERPIHQMLRHSFNEIVHHVAWAMDIFWEQRKALARRARTARSMFEAEAALADPIEQGLTVADFRSRPFEFVDANCETIHDKLSLYIGLTSFDAALRPGVERHLLIGKVYAKKAMHFAICRHKSMADRVARGGPLYIHGLAASIASAAPEGLAAVLGRLSRELQTDVALPISRGRQLVARLYWSDGVIKAWAHGHHHVGFDDREVTLRDYKLPDTIEGSLVGRRLDEIIDLPMVCRLRIRDVERPYDSAIILHLEDAIHTVDLASGSIGDEIIPF